MDWFPPEPRSFPFRSYVRNLLRAFHILFSGVLIGGHIFHQGSDLLEPWLFAAVISGVLLLIIDLHATLAVLFEVRGVLVIIKTIILLLVPVFWEQRIPLLLAVLFIGAIGSHLPKRIRHKVLLFGDQIVPDERSG